MYSREAALGPGAETHLNCVTGRTPQRGLRKRPHIIATHWVITTWERLVRLEMIAGRDLKAGSGRIEQAARMEFPCIARGQTNSNLKLKAP